MYSADVTLYTFMIIYKSILTPRFFWGNSMIARTVVPRPPFPHNRGLVRGYGHVCVLHQDGLPSNRLHCLNIHVCICIHPPHTRIPRPHTHSLLKSSELLLFMGCTGSLEWSPPPLSEAYVCMSLYQSSMSALEEHWNMHTSSFRFKMNAFLRSLVLTRLKFCVCVCVCVLVHVQCVQ